MHTITTTKQTAGLYSLTLMPKEASHSDKIKTLLQAVQKACDELPLESRASVSQWFVQWSKSFFKNYQPDSKVQEQQLDAATAIAYLIRSGLEHVMLNVAQEGSAQQVAWLDLSEEAKAILNGIVPDQGSEEFLECYDKYEAQKSLLKQYSKVEDNLRQSEEALYESANQINERLLFFDEKVRQELLKAQEKGEVKELYECVDTVSAEVGKLFEEAKQDVQHAQKVGQKLQETEDILKHDLDNAENILEKF